MQSSELRSLEEAYGRYNEKAKKIRERIRRAEEYGDLALAGYGYEQLNKTLTLRASVKAEINEEYKRRGHPIPAPAEFDV